MDENKENNNIKKSEGKLGRRDLLKGLVTVPVLGAFVYSAYQKNKYNKLIKASISEDVKLNAEAPTYKPTDKNSKTVRLGIIGYGGRGKYLARAAGFAHPEYVDQLIEQNKNDPNNNRYQTFLDQEDLNVVVNGVCDVFDTYGEMAREMAANLNKEGTGGKPSPDHARTGKATFA